MKLSSYLKMGRALFALLFLFSSTGNAADYYVGPIGNDANSGSLSMPFKTLKKGVSVLKPGDTLLIRTGTYAESLNDNIPAGSSWILPVTVRSYPGETVTLKPPTGTGWVLHFFEKQSYIIIDGLILDGINILHDTVKMTCNTDCSLNAHHIRIQNSEIKNGYGNGILAGGHGHELIRNSIHHNGRWGGDGVPDQAPGYGRPHGIYFTGNNSLIEDCEIYWNGGYGFHLYNSGSSSVSNNTIRGNRIHDNGHNTTRYGFASDPGLIISSGSDNKAYNNIIYNNMGMGIQLDYGARNSLVYNNTLYGNKGANGQYAAIYNGAGSSGAFIGNNLIYKNAVDAITSIGSSTLFNNLIKVDPLFVNPLTFDFRLQAGSPAIDKGQKVDLVATDIINVSRPQGNAYDIGAYEFTSAITPMPPLRIKPPKNLRVR